MMDEKKLQLIKLITEIKDEKIIDQMLEVLGVSSTSYFNAHFAKGEQSQLSTEKKIEDQQEISFDDLWDLSLEDD